MMLRMEGLGYRYGQAAPVLREVSAEVVGPAVIAIVGPNGAGKSTLLDLLAGQKTPWQGTCAVQGKRLDLLRRDELCRLVAHVPQHVPRDVPFTVEEVVLTGRIPYGVGLYESAEDYALMEQALRRTRLEAFRGRRFVSLSGGEQQRVLLAAALCQQAPVLLLDEPSAHLDPENQALLWELFAELKKSGHLVVVVTHHLALAAQNSDRIWLLDRGRLVADGPPGEALEPRRLEEVFHVPFYWHGGDDGRVFLTYGR
ncbi:MAG: ABC transporter ATP-binding protein [Bryobacterales bacterium]|nr:ABC transporter ATP-binding protein [Bryobacterales bacterium]